MLYTQCIGHFAQNSKKGFDKSAKMQYHEVTDRKQIENKTVTT